MLVIMLGMQENKFIVPMKDKRKKIIKNKMRKNGLATRLLFTIMAILKFP
jgi:hypothetical protein